MSRRRGRWRRQGARRDGCWRRPVHLSVPAGCRCCRCRCCRCRCCRCCRWCWSRCRCRRGGCCWGCGVGVGGAGGGEFGGEGVPAGAGFGGEVARDSAHPVGLLASDGQAAFAVLFFLVGHGAVGVEGQGESLGGLAKLVGIEPAGRAGELGFGVGAGADVDPVGQGAEELGDGVQVSGSDAALGLGGGDVIAVWGGGVGRRGSGGGRACGCRGWCGWLRFWTGAGRW